MHVTAAVPLPRRFLSSDSGRAVHRLSRITLVGWRRGSHTARPDPTRQQRWAISDAVLATNWELCGVHSKKPEAITHSVTNARTISRVLNSLTHAFFSTNILGWTGFRIRYDGK